jgi:hypothetical protein
VAADDLRIEIGGLREVADVDHLFAVAELDGRAAFAAPG